MKIGIIQGSTQKDKNEKIEFSYVQTAFCISLLIESKVVDFVVTGCTSGQGMMLACNSMPGLICGYAANPTDAYFFGRINNGNVMSFPLGLNFGWGGEINLQNTFKALFEEPFGIGYPLKDADRKKKDSLLVKKINSYSKKTLLDLIPCLDEEFLQSAFRQKHVCDFVMQNGKDERFKNILKLYR